MNETSRADLHVHSSASAVSKLGVQRSLTIPECATDPLEVYELAKARGMDFVTITDHDTIDGALSLDHLPDTFISEELTASFKGEPQAVHVLCFGITPEHHEWLQAHRDDVETCAAYLREHDITAALAHPFYAVEAPLTARHRRRLAELFPIWETRNGSRAKELNLPAFVYIETHGGTAIGGSDDHAGIDVGRTFTETPRAHTPAEFLAHIRAGRASAHGQQGSAAKWAHAAMALAIRSLGGGEEPARTGGVGEDLNPATVLRIVERVMREGDARHGIESRPPHPPRPRGASDALALLRAWLYSMELDVDEHKLLHQLQEGDLSHADLDRRARRVHERKLAAAVHATVADLERGTAEHRRLRPVPCSTPACPRSPTRASAAFLGREKAKLTRSDGDRPRVALVVDGIGGMHGRYPRDPADPRPRRARLRRRGDRHRRGRRSPAERGGRDRHPVLSGARDRRPHRAGHRRGAGRGPLRRRARLLTRPGRASPRGCSRGSWSCHASAATTPNSAPTRRCAPDSPRSRRWPTGPSAGSTAPATWCSRPARPAISAWPSWESLPGGSRAGIAASTCAASTPPIAGPGSCPAR